MPAPSSGSDDGPAGGPGAAGRFTRLVDYYGADGFARVRAARVVVIGLGGVGAHAAVALARSGVGRLVLVDHDSVTLSSLNRSPAATLDCDAHLTLTIRRSATCHRHMDASSMTIGQSSW